LSFPHKRESSCRAGLAAAGTAAHCRGLPRSHCEAKGRSNLFLNPQLEFIRLVFWRILPLKKGSVWVELGEIKTKNNDSFP